MESFYVFLPSNVYDITDRNTIGNYVTFLPQAMKLHGSWEVGLSEILITKKWFNIVHDEEIRFYKDGFGVTTQFCPVEAGCYRDFTSIMQKVYKCLQQLLGQFRKRPHLGDTYAPVLKPNRDKSRIVIIPGMQNGHQIFPILPKAVSEILGFEFSGLTHDLKKEVDVDGETIKGALVADRSVDINATINAVYVYSDIIRSSLVGDSFSKLLRVVNVPKIDFGQTIQQGYDQPQYFPLEAKEFQSIEIDLKDDAGETLRFDGGRVIVVFHFRKRYE